MSKRILIVDDSKVVHSLMNHFISIRYPELKLVSTYTGKDALTLIVNGEEFDLIFLDIVMPEMDGIEFLKEIKKRDIKVKAPIVVCSEAERTLIEHALQIGAVDVVTKPFKNVDLYAILEKHIFQSG